MSRNVSENGLTPKQLKAVAALMTSKTTTEAAAAAGINRRTLTRWLADPAFRAALRDAQDEAIAAALLRLAGAAAGAIETLTEIAGNAAAPEAPRVSAARAILSSMVTIKEKTDTAERLALLEMAMGRYLREIELELNEYRSRK